MKLKPTSKYRIAWNPSKNEGTILLQVPNGVELLNVDSAKEARALLRQLRMEDNNCVSSSGLFMTGFQPSGDDEAEEKTSLPTEKDNLQLLDHVDARIEKILNAEGIYTFDQLANADQNFLKNIYLYNHH